MSSTPAPTVPSWIKPIEPLDGHEVALAIYHTSDPQNGTQLHMSRQEARQLIEMLEKQLDPARN